MKRKYLIIVVTILIVLFTAWIGILASYMSNLVGPSFRPFALPLLIIIAVIVAFLTVWLYILQKATDEPPPLDRQNRHRMLAKVYARWIAGVLDHIFQDVAPIKLRLREQSEFVENPWKQTFQESDQPAYLLSPGTPIDQVYDEAGGGLLILGEPGSGKTILLLELTRELLGRAEHDDNQPIPVYFNLSSWAAKGRSIADWLIDELNSKYQVPDRLGRSWVENDQILPLLDGLDEVNPEHS